MRATPKQTAARDKMMMMMRRRKHQEIVIPTATKASTLPAFLVGRQKEEPSYGIASECLAATEKFPSYGTVEFQGEVNIFAAQEAVLCSLNAKFTELCSPGFLKTLQVVISPLEDNTTFTYTTTTRCGKECPVIKRISSNAVESLDSMPAVESFNMSTDYTDFCKCSYGEGRLPSSNEIVESFNARLEGFNFYMTAFTENELQQEEEVCERSDIVKERVSVEATLVECDDHELDEENFCEVLMASFNKLSADNCDPFYSKMESCELVSFEAFENGEDETRRLQQRKRKRGRYSHNVRTRRRNRRIGGQGISVRRLLPVENQADASLFENVNGSFIEQCRCVTELEDPTFEPVTTQAWNEELLSELNALCVEAEIASIEIDGYPVPCEAEAQVQLCPIQFLISLAEGSVVSSVDIGKYFLHIYSELTEATCGDYLDRSIDATSTIVEELDESGDWRISLQFGCIGGCDILPGPPSIFDDADTELIPCAVELACLDYPHRAPTLEEFSSRWDVLDSGIWSHIPNLLSLMPIEESSDTYEAVTTNTTFEEQGGGYETTTATPEAIATVPATITSVPETTLVTLEATLLTAPTMMTEAEAAKVMEVTTISSETMTAATETMNANVEFETAAALVETMSTEAEIMKAAPMAAAETTTNAFGTTDSMTREDTQKTTMVFEVSTSATETTSTTTESDVPEKTTTPKAATTSPLVETTAVTEMMTAGTNPMNPPAETSTFESIAMSYVPETMAALAELPSTTEIITTTTVSDIKSTAAEMTRTVTKMMSAAGTTTTTPQSSTYTPAETAKATAESQTRSMDTTSIALLAATTTVDERTTAVKMTTTTATETTPTEAKTMMSDTTLDPPETATPTPLESTTKLPEMTAATKVPQTATKTAAMTTMPPETTTMPPQSATPLVTTRTPLQTTTMLPETTSMTNTAPETMTTTTAATTTTPSQITTTKTVPKTTTTMIAEVITTTTTTAKATTMPLQTTTTEFMIMMPPQKTIATTAVATTMSSPATSTVMTAASTAAATTTTSLETRTVAPETSTTATQMTMTVPETAATTLIPKSGIFEGFVFEDLNENGDKDPDETGFEYVDVVITDSSGAKLTVTTDSNGFYSAIVLAGTATSYIEGATLPLGFERVSGEDPTIKNVVADAAATDMDGFKAGKTGILRGCVFDDKNENGEKDPGERPFEGVDVLITESSGAKQTVTTDSNGFYTAVVLARGTTFEIVKETMPPGFQKR